MKKYYDKNIGDIVYHASDLIRVVSVKPIDNYKLIVGFTTGEKKLYDVSPLLAYPIFAELKNESFFKTAKVDYGTVIWSDDIDLCPDSLYTDSVLFED